MGGVLQKTRIESLSDLIFGLALSIGALTLIGQAPNDFQSLLLSLAFYGFSFIILISVWYSYTQTMSFLHVETKNLVNFNILLLFLVSIEPFLFNQLINSSSSLAMDISILYAFDLGGLFAIQALFANSIVSDKSKPEQVIRHFRVRRNTQLISMALFFISTLPIFWTWTIPVDNNFSIPLRIMFWIFTLLFMSSIRSSLEKRGKQTNKQPVTKKLVTNGRKCRLVEGD
jgi:uncharacterized membrane protein